VHGGVCLALCGAAHSGVVLLHGARRGHVADRLLQELTQLAVVLVFGSGSRVQELRLRIMRAVAGHEVFAVRVNWVVTFGALKAVLLLQQRAQWRTAEAT